MLAKSYIRANLDRLDVLYRKAKTTQQALFFSKLAIIELCGWIEMSMDEIVRCCSKRNLKNAANRNHIENAVIKRTSGFDYNQHFRDMLIQVIGLKSVERIENRMDASKLQKLTAALSTLKILRNREAHTYLKGVTAILDAPSITKARFTDIYEGLQEIENCIRLVGL